MKMGPAAGPVLKLPAVPHPGGTGNALAPVRNSLEWTMEESKNG